jgi:flagellar biosynthesis/type III secretory pathway chaperone
MTREALKERLHELLELIRRERECARQLAVTELMETAERKGAVLAGLEGLESADISDELRELARTVRRENRRNAFLFWNTLHWLRDLMVFVDHKTGSHTYGATAGMVKNRSGGRLLSGRI